jgi:hypothetical protein
MPVHADLQEALAAAIDEYRQNASFNLGSQPGHRPDGEQFMLVDPDAGI